MLIIGGGPAGRALAIEFARLSRSVTIVDANPNQPWNSTYGTWVDDLDNRDDAAELQSCFQRTWPQVRVVGKVEHHLSRPYGIFDNNLLQKYLTDDAVKFCEGVVVRVQHSDENILQVQLSSNERYEARAVFDLSLIHI